MGKSSYFPEGEIAGQEQQAMISGEDFESLKNMVTEYEHVHYASDKAVPRSFWCWSVLWCGCCAPTYIITDSTKEITECTFCGKETEGLLFDNISEVRLEKSCWCACWGCCPFLDDVGDILVYGSDTRCREKGTSFQRLKHIFESRKLYDTLTVVIQDKHKDFRLQERNLGYGLQAKKERLGAR